MPRVSCVMRLCDHVIHASISSGPVGLCKRKPAFARFRAITLMWLHESFFSSAYPIRASPDQGYIVAGPLYSL